MNKNINITSCICRTDSILTCRIFTVNMLRKFCLFYCSIAEQIQLVKVTWIHIIIYVVFMFCFFISRKPQSQFHLFSLLMFSNLSLLCCVLFCAPFCFCFQIFFLTSSSEILIFIIIYLAYECQHGWKREHTHTKKRKGFCGLKMKFEGLLLMMICA